MNTNPITGNIPSLSNNMEHIASNPSHNTPSSGQLENHTVTHADPSHKSRIQKTTTMRLRDGTWYEGWRDQHGKTIEDSFTDTSHLNPDEEEGIWTTVGLEPSLLSNTLSPDPIAEVIKNHSRSDGITKKIASYQERLYAPETPLTPEEREKFTNLITVFTAARTYQDSMIHHLATSPISSDPRIAQLQQAEKLFAMERLNERPNKIELLAEKLEQDYKNLSDFQASEQQRQSEIAAEPPIDNDNRRLMDIHNRRLESLNHLRSAIAHQKELIQERVTMASLLPRPYEPLDEKKQKDLNTYNTHKWHSIQLEVKAQSQELRAKAVLDDYHGFYLKRAADDFEQVALEAQKKEPRQESIKLLTQSASLKKEAAEAQAAGLSMKAVHLNCTGDVFVEAAQEAQKEKPSQESIKLFTQAASFYKEAAEAYDAELHPDLNRKVIYLYQAGDAYFYAAQEAQKEKPSQESIKLFTQSATLKKEAAEAYDPDLDPDLNRKATYLYQAGDAYFYAAQEAQKSKPKQETIELFTQAASLKKEVVNAKDSDLHDKASYLDKAGDVFFKAAQEAQKEKPRRTSIKLFTQAASLYQQAAKEAEQTNPNRRSIEEFLSKAIEYERQAAPKDASYCTIS